MEELLVGSLVLTTSIGFSGFIAWTHPNWKGVLVGTVTLWLFLFLGLVLLAGRYGGEGPGGLLVPVWFVSGWFFSGLFTCGVRYVAKGVE